MKQNRIKFYSVTFWVAIIINNDNCCCCENVGKKPDQNNSCF